MKIYGMETTVGKRPVELSTNMVIAVNKTFEALFEAFIAKKKVFSKGLEVTGIPSIFGGMAFSRIRNWLAYHQILSVKKNEKKETEISPTPLGWKVYVEGVIIEVDVNGKKIKVGVGKKFPNHEALWKKHEAKIDAQVTKATWGNWPWDFRDFFVNELAALTVEEAEKKTAEWVEKKLSAAPKRKVRSRTVQTQVKDQSSLSAFLPQKKTGRSTSPDLNTKPQETIVPIVTKEQLLKQADEKMQLLIGVQTKSLTIDERPTEIVSVVRKTKDEDIDYTEPYKEALKLVDPEAVHFKRGEDQIANGRAWEITYKPVDGRKRLTTMVSPADAELLWASAINVIRFAGRLNAPYDRLPSEFSKAKPTYYLKNPTITPFFAKLKQTVPDIIKLLCFPGTNIYCHDFLEHCDPDKDRFDRDQKPLPSDLKYGSTTVAYLNSEWFFDADFDHCKLEDLKHNIRTLRKMLEKHMKGELSKLKLYIIHKDYDDGVYIVTRNKVPNATQKPEGMSVWQGDPTKCWDQWETAKPWNLLDGYNPPLPQWKINQQKELEKKHENCPVCINKAFLQSLGELKPEVTGNKDVDYHLAMNVNYHCNTVAWALNWLVLKNKFEVDNTPKCKECEQPIFTSVIFGCDTWKKDVKSGLCKKHDPEKIRLSIEFEKKYEMETPKITPFNQKELFPVIEQKQL